MPTQDKPSVVFAHGIWADGSSFAKVIPSLQAEGHQVISTQNSLDSLKGDVDAVTRALGRARSPAILVGHSYGGTVITAAGNDPRVAGLVYIAALAPGESETSQSQQDKFPKTEILQHVEVAAPPMRRRKAEPGDEPEQDQEDDQCDPVDILHDDAPSPLTAAGSTRWRNRPPPSPPRR